MDRTAELKAKIERLQKKKSALLTQSRLLQDFVSLAKSSAKEQILTAILQKTLDLTAELTKAETGSLFLLDPDGVVRDCILTRGPRQAKECLDLTGTVLEGGLAGWVMRNNRIGLITDTEKDDRWLNLPGQPYTVRSAMAVPISRDNELLGILTLLHSQPGVFHQGTADVMEVTAGQLGLALESAKLYSKLDEYSRALDAELEKGKQIQKEFLPRELPRPAGWDIAACFHAARQVSGDFYDAFMLPNGCLAVVVGDVCDKGIGSALFHGAHPQPDPRLYRQDQPERGVYFRRRPARRGSDGCGGWHGLGSRYTDQRVHRPGTRRSGHVCNPVPGHHQPGDRRAGIC